VASSIESTRHSLPLDMFAQARCPSSVVRARASLARPGESSRVRAASRAARAALSSSSSRRARAGRANAAHEMVELASAFDAVNMDITLSGAEEALGKCAFASLALASGVFASKVRRARASRVVLR